MKKTIITLMLTAIITATNKSAFQYQIKKTVVDILGGSTDKSKKPH